MIGFNHALAGAIIGIVTPTPLVPFVALASHFLMDMLPHFGEHSRIKPYTKSFKALLVFDALMCFSILATSLHIRPDMHIGIILGTFFACLPDFLWLVQDKVKSGWAKAYFKFAKKIQWGETPDGWTYELFAFGLLVLIFSIVI